MTCKRCGAALASTRATYCPPKTACGRARNSDQCRARYWGNLDRERARMRARAREYPDKAHKWSREHPEAAKRSAQRAAVKHRALHRETIRAKRRATYLATGK